MARFADLPRPAQWAALLALSVGLWALLGAAHVPAALLLGPMLAGILMEAGGARIRVPPKAYLGAQAVIGGFIAGAIQPSSLLVVGQNWALFVALVLSMVAATSIVGWLMSRWRLLPATTAIWGLSPGAAPAMMLMAEAFGADLQLVAFMQYLRVAMIALVASVVAGLSGHETGAAAGVDWFAPLHWDAFAKTLAIIVVGGLVGSRSRLPAGALLVPLAIGIVLHGAGYVEIEMPPWLRAASYMAVGWRIGLGFTRPLLAHAARALPAVLGAISITIAFAAALAVPLAKIMGMDLLTAYLATSPGGMDSIAVIAASSHVDLSFIIALQTARFLIVMLIGPTVARFVAARSGVPA